jgi:hypothetical protein
MSDILESKGYLYVNAEGKIMSITTTPMEVIDLIEIVVSKHIAQQFMDGTMSMYDWTATIDKNGYTLISNRNITRNTKTVYEHPSLVKVRHLNLFDYIIITLRNNSIRIDNRTDKTLHFFITRKDDPSILYKSVTVNDTVTESLPTTDVDIYSFTINSARIIHED